MLPVMNPIASVMLGGSTGAAGLAGLTTTALKPPGHTDGGGAPFADLLTNAVGDVSRLENEAQNAVSGLMTGSGVDVHQAMIATEKASMAFELSLAVRNKAIQAYQQVMSMQF